MSKKPTVDQEQVEAAEEPSKEGETMQMVKQLAEAKSRWNPSRKQIGVAAIGVGSAAVVAALLYWRGNKK